jgi:predicted phage terminase large subunit-like protein
MDKLEEELNIASKIAQDPLARRAVSKESFYWFFNIYFPHYVKYQTADFHREIFTLLEKDDISMFVLVAFRGSGKSTIVTMAYVLWAILGRQKKKYAIIAGLTQRQARQHLQNIKRELESNTILKSDLGPFREEQDEWGSLSLVISNCGAKITAASTEQSIRGMRHGQYRPDLIICDDVEDLASVKTMESRDKTHRWFSGDVVPAGDVNTRVIVVGNLLHEDSLIMRLKESIENSELSGFFKKYPFLDESGICLWPGKFPDIQSIDAERKKVGNYNAWMREYMLSIIPEDDQVVLMEWIQRYDTLPKEDGSFRYFIASADLAISQRETADYTAIVIAKVFGWGDKLRIYILPHPFNRRIKFVEQVEEIKTISKQYGRRIKILIESNAYQQSLVEQLQRKELCPVEGVKTYGEDKRARLSLITPHLKNSIVLFPRTGAEHLIQQLVGFGVEKHDDLADALTMLISYCTANNGPSPRETFDSFLRLNKGLLENNPDGLWNKRF